MGKTNKGTVAKRPCTHLDTVTTADPAIRTRCCACGKTLSPLAVR